MIHANDDDSRGNVNYKEDNDGNQTHDVGGVDGGAAGLIFSLFSFFFLWVVFLTPHSCCFLFFLLFDDDDNDDDDDDDDDVEGTCCCCCCCCSWFSMSRTWLKT